MDNHLTLAIILLIIGIGLFFLEAIIPSMGILTIIGAILVVTGIGFAFSVSALYGVIAVACTLVAVPLAVMFFFYIAHNTGIVLKGDEEGYTSSPSKKHLVGKQGVAASYLRPAGIAVIDGQRVDVTAEGDFIPEGSRIEVLRVDGLKAVVRRVSTE